MIAIMKEMKYLIEREQTMQEVASKAKRQFSNELGGAALFEPTESW